MPKYVCNACRGTGDYEGKLRGEVACEHCGARWYKLRRVGDDDGGEPKRVADPAKRAASPRIGQTPAQQRCLALLRSGAPLHVSHELGLVYGGKWWQADPPAEETVASLIASGLVERASIGIRRDGHEAFMIRIVEAATAKEPAHA